MEKTKEYTSPYEMDGRIPWPKAIVYGLQHVLAMFVGNLTPLIVICGACGIGAASDFAEVYVELLQNAMIIAGVVTLVQLFAIGPVGGRVPIIMGTSSGFIGVFKSVAGVMGGGVIATAPQIFPCSGDRNSGFINRTFPDQCWCQLLWRRIFCG